MGYLKRKLDIPTRYVFITWCFLGLSISMMMRINLSVAIVAMVKSSPINDTQDNTSTPLVCQELFVKLQNNSLYSSTEPQGEFDWDRKQQSNILGAIFYGILVTRLPGGILSKKWSTKWTIGLTTLVGSLLTFLSPVAARWNVNAFIALRVIIGFAQGILLPSSHAMIGRWAPKMERSWMLALLSSGFPMGSAIGLMFSGFLSKSNLWGGWPSAFYVSGILGCLWCVFWLFLIQDNPEEHPRIFPAELLYITENKITPKATSKIPWVPILTSAPLWALVVAEIGYNWCFYTLFNLMPTYLANVLHLSIEKNGVLSSLPYLLCALSFWLAGYTGDKLRQSGKYSINTVRKIFNSIGFFGAGFFILLVAFVGCRPAVSISLLCLSLGFIGVNISGYRVTHVDMSPQFAGILSGIFGTIGGCGSFLAPYVAGVITSNGETLHNWGMVFGITAGLAFVSGITFVVFASAELQPWNPPLEDLMPQGNLKLETDFKNKNTTNE